MPFNFGVAIFFALLALFIFLPAVFVYRRFNKKHAERQVVLAAKHEEKQKENRQSRWGTSDFVEEENPWANATKSATGLLVLSVILAGVFTFAASANTVEIRNVGIVTSFKKPTGETTGSGFQLVKPWEKVTDWEVSIQTADNTGAGFKDDHQNACQGSTLVRIGSMATACVENKIRWQVVETAAPDQFFDYKGDFESFRKNYFETERQNALNEVFSSYNPLKTFDAKVGQPEFDLAVMEQKLLAVLNRRLAGQVTVVGVSIPLIHHDAKTEQTIKAQQDLISQARNLDQQKTNADKQKLVTDIKGKTSPVQQCLDNNKELSLSGGSCLQPGFPIAGK